jgi:hypothetical protein
MEVCSSNEMGAPGASHLGTGDHGPKTDRSKPRVPVNGLPSRDLPQLVDERPIAESLIEEADSHGRLVGCSPHGFQRVLSF